MCGIAGIVDWNGVRREQVESMTATLRHRGPDDEGIWVKGPAGLGHTRLSVIDLSQSGHQPLPNEDRSLWLSYNGELYNFESLREELSACGHLFRSRTDSEVIPHAYEEYGVECLKRFRGMFAFALWDQKQQLLFAARDRFGIKPFYYYHHDGFFACASEIKALLSLPQVPKEADRDAVWEYVHLRYVPAPRTFFRRIRKLPPGHYLTFSPKGCETRRFWSPLASTEEIGSIAEAAERFHQKFTEAVRLHLISDVPIGVFLSGGLDSSTLAAVAAQESSKPLKTFCAAFPEAGWHDERRFARRVADHLGTDHTEIEVEPAQFEQLYEVTRFVEEPLCDPAVLSTYLLASEARKQVTVVLTGEGSDEIQAGYRSFQNHALAEGLGRIPVPLQSLVRAIVPVLPHQTGRKLEWLFQAFPQRFVQWRHEALEGGLGQSLWKDPEYARRPNPLLELSDVYSGPDVLLKLSHAAISGWMINALLLKVDKTTMAHGLEARVPYLDHMVAETGLATPSRLKVSPWCTKRVLRHLARRLLPPEICRRRQHGFNVPIQDWIREDPQKMMVDCLSPERIRSRGYFNPDFVAEALRRHREGTAEASLFLWTVAALEVWHQVWELD